MLETEEVDVDYFTPSASTSLAKIFVTSSREEDTIENNSLKYNPPLPPQVVTTSEEPKQTQYLFAGTVFAYEWLNDSYEFRGKLGFAIFQTVKFGMHKVVIYDSSKSTLSSLTIDKSTEIKVIYNKSISYYDNQQKFWCINPSTHLNEILEILKKLQVNLKYMSIEDSENGTLMKEHGNTSKETTNKLKLDEKESDTDASINRKTKDSILKRMATMGQSVLPPPYAATANSSDSSDTEIHNQQKLRYRPKVTHKKNNLEKKPLETDNYESNVRKPSPEMCRTYKEPPNIDNNQQIVPVGIMNIKPPETVSLEENNMGLFISEQRVSNSELRINMNRMSDKLETLLDKVKNLEIVDKSKYINNSNMSPFQNEIIQKLLHEYEQKIRKYEDFIKLKGFDCDTLDISVQSPSYGSKHKSVKDTELERTKLYNLEQLCKEKDKEIIQLNGELQLLSKKTTEFQNLESTFVKEISDLKHNFLMTANVTKKIDDNLYTEKQSNDMTNKLKQIMNDTFQAISVNFDDEEQYTGSTIKSIVGLVVKKTTIDSLKEY